MMSENGSKKVGLLGLVAIVFTSMVGSSVYNLPQNMAVHAGAAAVLIAWIITGLGMYYLANTFKVLAENKPELTAGIYSYAKAGFGQYMGFNSAWGYWISGALGNVAFAILLNDAIGYFYPPLLEHGIPTLLFSIVFIWGMSFIVTFGVSFATKISGYSIFIVLTAIAVILLVLLYYFDFSIFIKHFWGNEYHNGSLLNQIKSTMMITLWSFIGIEGAVVISSRAKNSSDVGKATLIGLIIALVLYSLISLLSFGILEQPELASLSTPSAGYLMAKASGEWANTFVAISVILSLLVSWLAWTVLVSQVPYDAAKDGVLPKIFTQENQHHSPVSSLIITALLMSVMMLVVIYANNVYIAAVTIASVMILPPYILSAAYLWEVSDLHEILADKPKERHKAVMIGILATFYGAWLLYSAGLSYLMMSSIFYSLGIPFYYRAQHEHFPDKKHVFSKYERILAIFILTCSAISLIMLMEGKLVL